MRKYVKLRNSKPVFLFLLVFSAHIVSAQSPGFFLDDWQGKSAEIPDFEVVDKPSVDPTLTVTVDLSNELNRVPQYIYGNNAVTWDNGLTANSTAMTDLKNLNPHVLRWPGGSLSNSYFWNVPYGERPTDIPNDVSPWYGMNTQSWQMSVDEYYDLLEQTGSTGSICVNYSYARYGTSEDPVGAAAHMAADWVRYDNGRSKFWEIGNENFGSWEKGNIIDTDLNQDGQPAKISGQLYGQHASRFIDSMRAAATETGADIKIGVVTYDAENSYDPISQDWNEGMMPIVGDKADFLIVHSYFTPYDQDSPVSTILNSHTVPGTIMSAVEADMAEAGKPMLPVAMTEWNIFAVGSMQQVSYINGMLAAITLGEYVKNNYGMANRWDLVNGWNDGNDHGMFSTGGEPGVDPYNPRAVFFYMYYHQKFFGDQMVASSVSGSSNIVSHASTFASGETGIVLVNKSRSSETAEIVLENGDYGFNYYYYTLTGGDDNGDFSRKVLINGIETDEQGGGPDNYESIKARSSDCFSGIVVDLPPLSAVYLLVDKEAPLSYVGSVIDTNNRVITVRLNDIVQPVDNPQGFEVMLNGTSQVPVSNVAIDPDYPFLVHLYLGQEIGHDDELTLSYSGTDIVDFDGVPLIVFADEPVENLLPGGPYTVSVISVSQGDLIDGVTVQLDEETRLSDAAGESLFSVMEGQYGLTGSKAHYTQVSETVVSITSDTTLYLELEPDIYTVSFHITDSNTGDDLSDVHLTYTSGFTVTDAEGYAGIEAEFGSFTVSLGKTNYQSIDSTFEISSDTTLEIALTRTHASVKFRIKNGEMPVVNATVDLNGESLQTGPAGTITFSSVPLYEPLGYTVVKEDFIDLTGSLQIDDDTTLNLQMEKAIANIEFLLSFSSGPPEEAYVILDGDSCAVSAAESCFFYGKEKGVSYDYKAGATGFEIVNGSILLEKDTIVNIMLKPVSSLETGKENIRVYPNPAKGKINISDGSGFLDEVSIIDITGNVVFSHKMQGNGESLQIDPHIPSGIYFIRIYSRGQAFVRKLVIR